MAAEAMRSTRGRTWADVLALLTSVVLLALAIWPGDPTASEEASLELGSAQMVWALHALCGLLGLGGLVIAQRWRWRTIGRVMVGVAGVALLAALIVTRDFSARSLLLLLVPGAALLASSLAVGPMPPPEEH